MKSIFIIGSCFPAELGGPSNTIYRFAKALTASNNDVLVWSTLKGITNEHKKKYNIRKNKSSEVDGVNVVFFDYFLSHLFPIKLFLKLLTLENKDKVNLSSMFYFPNIIIMLVLTLRRIKFTIAPRGELFEEALNNKRGIKLLFLLILKPLIRKASAIVVTSEEEVKTVQKYFDINRNIIKVIPNYIEINHSAIYTPGACILYLGRLHPHKCIDNLITAYQGLPSIIRKRYALKLAGSGQQAYKNYLLEVASRDSFNIHFIGHITDNEKADTILQSSILVLPSKSENFGNVILEALTFSKPVIACHNSPWQSVVQRKCGYFTSNKPSAINRVLIDFLSLSENEKQVMGNNARRYAEEEFSITKNINNLIKVFM